ncbi:MAG: DUF4328 domain-containing protein, partial [Deltaproteobacteria bacterium]
IDALAVPLGYVATVIAILAYIASSFWIYRSAANARHIRPAPDRITPGWAVGWFFVPFANLVKPFQAMRQTWNTSHSKSGSIDQPCGPLVSWWWTAWILASITSNISLRLTFSANELFEYRTAAILSLISSPLAVASAILFITLIRNITAAQANLRGSAYEEIFN